MHRNTIRVLALFAVGALASVGSAGVSRAQVPGEDGGVGADERRPLKRPFDVKLQLGDTELSILDVRDAEAFDRGHIPGAVRVNVTEWKEKSLAPDGLADLDWWTERLGRMGVSSTSQVVVYGDAAPEVARVWWVLRYLGLEHVSVLDGGYPAWLSRRYPQEWDTVEPETAKFVATPQEDRVCTLDELRTAIKEGGPGIVDARSDAEHQGDAADARTGRIPGAVHLEWSELLNPDGTYKKPDAIRAILKDRGIDVERDLVTHCQSGGRASSMTFALELAGAKRVANYYPGWSEYGGTDLPVEKSPATAPSDDAKRDE